MVCPIVSVYKDRGEVLIYGGSVHFSKDFIDQNKNKSFGYAYKYEDIWKERKKAGFIKSLSQEHGIISVNNVENYRVGDLLAIIPIHSCLTVDKMGSFFVDQEKLSIMRY
jgi:D-serine deaminase-like pyridoxal phosphate-dependent protein